MAIILIPALNPDKKLIVLINELQANGFKKIIIINDGSEKKCEDIFKKAEQIGCTVVCHSKNLGKGEAIKSGIKGAIEKYGNKNAYITADADGQHRVADICKINEALVSCPDSLILGIRDFSSSNVPWKSYWGNKITALVFKLTNGIDCPDTQTGLRGIPSSLEELALAEDGSRYEYEMNFLESAAAISSIVYVPIETVYENNNSCSHFRPVADSIRVYGRFLRYTCSSLVCAAADYIMFYIFTLVFSFSRLYGVIFAAVLARLFSGGINYGLNRCWSFKSKGSIKKQGLRYFLLFMAQMSISAILTGLLSLALPPVLAKLPIDTALFFISFVIQKNWVFERGVSNEYN